jgi:hypothetical protein
MLHLYKYRYTCVHTLGRTGSLEFLVIFLSSFKRMSEEYLNIDIPYTSHIQPDSKFIHTIPRHSNVDDSDRNTAETSLFNIIFLIHKERINLRNMHDEFKIFTPWTEYCSSNFLSLLRLNRESWQAVWLPNFIMDVSGSRLPWDTDNSDLRIFLVFLSPARYIPGYYID